MSLNRIKATPYGINFWKGKSMCSVSANICGYLSSPKPSVPYLCKKMLILLISRTFLSVETIPMTVLLIILEVKAFIGGSIMAEGIEEITDIPNNGFIGKPINTRTFTKEISQFVK